MDCICCKNEQKEDLNVLSQIASLLNALYRDEKIEKDFITNFEKLKIVMYHKVGRHGMEIALEVLRKYFIRDIRNIPWIPDSFTILKCIGLYEDSEEKRLFLDAICQIECEYYYKNL